MARRRIYPGSTRTNNVDGLNPEQAIAASHFAGPMAILAQAGSGKTKTLVRLVANLVKNGVQGDKILAVTFSRKAAEEMKIRGEKEGLTASFSTWHSFAMTVLKTDQTQWASWTVDESNRAKICVKEAIGYKHLNWKDADIGKVLSYIGICKAHAAEPDSRKAKELATAHFGSSKAMLAVQAYSISQDLIENAGLLTYDDMLMFVVRWFGVEENRRRWANKFDFVLQDEAQDSNPIQTMIAEALTKESGNYVVVGDPAQSIYGFRGSSPEAVTSFKTRYPSARVVHMNRNYRSCKRIVEVANKAIAPAKIRLPCDMLAERNQEGEVNVIRATTLDDEANEFVSYIKQARNEGASYADITCLFRTNAQSRALEEGLLSAQIPYVIIGGTSFYERKEVKDLLSYLRVALGKDRDGDAVKRCINAPFRFLGARFVEKLAPRLKGTDPVDAVEATAHSERLQGRQRSSALEWANIIKGLRTDIAEAAKMGRGPSEILNNLVQRTGFLDWLVQEEGEEALESSHSANIRELIRVAARFKTVEDLLTYIEKSIQAASKQRKEAAGGGDRVLLMSIHRSKGLEWPRVWVCGVNEKILPHGFGDPEEERRLFYVAVTRARDVLHLSYVTQFATGDGVKPGHPSSFLVDAGLIDVPSAAE